MRFYCPRFKTLRGHRCLYTVLVFITDNQHIQRHQYNNFEFLPRASPHACKNDIRDPNPWFCACSKRYLQAGGKPWHLRKACGIGVFWLDTKFNSDNQVASKFLYYALWPIDPLLDGDAVNSGRC
jgi:hypothetical protein